MDWLVLKRCGSGGGVRCARDSLDRCRERLGRGRVVTITPRAVMGVAGAWGVPAPLLVPLDPKGYGWVGDSGG